MRVERAMFRVDECLRQSLETLGRAEPDELGVEVGQRSAEIALKGSTNEGIDAVRCDDQVVTGQPFEVRHLHAELQIRADASGTLLQ
jgi:hypothetical protein